MQNAVKRYIHLACCLIYLALFCSGVAVADTAEIARRIAGAAGERGGLVVHAGCGDGELTLALRSSDRYLVQGLDVDPANVARARTRIRSHGRYGPVSADRFDGMRLPYAEDLVNVFVQTGGSVAIGEIERVLAPRGMAFLMGDASSGKGLVPVPSVPGLDGWTVLRKPVPPESDEWTHYRHGPDGNAVSQDSRIGPPRRLRWTASPRFSKSHEYDPSIAALVSAAGRVIAVVDKESSGIKDPRLRTRWTLLARDAHNGLLLWERPLPKWGWHQWTPELGKIAWDRLDRRKWDRTLMHRLVASGDRVFVTLDYDGPVSVLSAVTGETIRTLDATAGTQEILLVDGMLVVYRSVDEAYAITAVCPDSGKVLWEAFPNGVLTQTLAAAYGSVVYADGKDLVCLEPATGAERWRTPCKAADSKRTREGNSVTVIRKDVVLFSNGAAILALAPDTGTVLWTEKGDRTGKMLFVIDGLVWNGLPAPFPAGTPKDVIPDGPVETRVEKHGRDPLTGTIVRTVKATNLVSCGHHMRCFFPVPATERYMLFPKRGVEFLDLEGDNHDRCDWVRGGCVLAYMPANGLLYVTPHPCFCYPGVLLNGFLALAAEGQGTAQPVRQDAAVPRLERGPAYGTLAARATAAGAGDWSTFRGDERRSGSTPSRVPETVRQAWAVQLNGRLTQPVVSGRQLLVAEVDAHTVHCLDSGDGRTLWSFTTGGRIDSPPTLVTGRVLFGSADGWVYCLRASDGALAWRFRAAPGDRRIIAFDQLESAWPMHGNVLVREGIAYCTAGRSSFLDGGIAVYGLDVTTGIVRYQHQLQGPFPKLPDDRGRPFDMEGARSEVLVSEGDSIYLRQVRFDKALERQETPRITRMGDRAVGRHLFSTESLLSPTWYSRTVWMYSKIWPGFYYAHNAPRAGQMLVFDSERCYSISVFNRNRRVLFPGTYAVQLVCDKNRSEPVLKDTANRDKGPGFSRAEPELWKIDLPILPRAVVLAGDTLFLAGPSNTVEGVEALTEGEGTSDASLVAVSARDGRIIATQALEFSPVFDGLIAAQGRLYMSSKDGKLRCLKSLSP